MEPDKDVPNLKVSLVVTSFFAILDLSLYCLDAHFRTPLDPSYMKKMSRPVGQMKGSYTSSQLD